MMLKNVIRTTLAAAAVAALGLAGAAGAHDIKSIKVGYAISKTGPNAGGAATTNIPQYEMWVKEVNARGGLMLKSLGRRVPIEVVEYDDRSSSEEAVRAVERVGDLRADPQQVGAGQRTLAQPLRQRLALDQLHHQVVGRALAADVEQRADVRVVEAGDGLRLALEAGPDLLVGRQVLRQHLDRDLAAKAGVLRAVHLAHAAGAKRREDLVGAQLRSVLEHFGCLSYRRFASERMRPAVSRARAAGRVRGGVTTRRPDASPAASGMGRFP